MIIFQYFNCIGGIFNCCKFFCRYYISILQLYRWNIEREAHLDIKHTYFNTSTVSVEFFFIKIVFIFFFISILQLYRWNFVSSLFLPGYTLFQYFNCIGGIDNSISIAFISLRFQYFNCIGGILSIYSISPQQYLFQYFNCIGGINDLQTLF